VEVQPKNQQSKTTLRTADRALSCLEFVASAYPPPQVRQVAEGLKLNITTTYHLINTLRARGYVASDRGGGVRLGPASAVLYRAMMGHLKQGGDLRQVVERLSTETKETVYLGVLVGHGVVIDTLIEGSKTLRVGGLHVGYHGMEHLRAAGKAALANLPADDLQGYIDSVSIEIGPERAAGLLTQLEVVRDAGYAVDDEGYEPGVCCVAAPYYRADGRVAGSIAVSLPAVRFAPERDQLAASVLEAGHSLSTLLGFTGTAQPSPDTAST